MPVAKEDAELNAHEPGIRGAAILQNYRSVPQLFFLPTLHVALLRKLCWLGAAGARRVGAVVPTGLLGLVSPPF